jgi:hypothetical protein
MAVFALWSAPRARSTAFFRSMAERDDMTVRVGATFIKGKLIRRPGEDLQPAASAAA